MSIYITGDIHGDPRRFSNRSMEHIYYRENLGPDDLMLICGDFGLPWGGRNAKTDKYWLDWLEGRGTTFAFIDGNHENHPLLASFPVKLWHGGRVHAVRPNVLHLMRGEVYHIAGCTFFAFGGAASIDKAYRVEGESWWPEEEFSAADYLNAKQNLERVGYRVDFALTHTAPREFIQPKAKQLGIRFTLKQDRTMEFLSGLARKLHYRWWYFGHFHENWTDRLRKCRGIYQSIDLIEPEDPDWEPNRRKYILYSNAKDSQS